MHTRECVDPTETDVLQVFGNRAKLGLKEATEDWDRVILSVAT